MKKSRTWNFGATAGKVMLGLVLAAMIGSIDIAPALGKDNHDRGGKYDNRHYEQRGHAYGHDRYHGPDRYYGPYGYRERVYVPPPVVYAPPPPPGIGIFFPPLIIHR